MYTQLAPNDPKLNLGRFLATFHKIYNARFAKVHQFLKNGQNYYIKTSESSQPTPVFVTVFIVYKRHIIQKNAP